MVTKDYGEYLDKPIATATGRNLHYFAIIFTSQKKRGVRMVQTTLRMPEKLYVQLKKQAKEKGLSVNALIIGILWKVKEKGGR